MVWPLLCLAVLVLGWALLLTGLNNQRASAENFALRNSRTIAQAYADHLDRNFDTIDQIALYIRYAWHLSGKTLKLEDISGQGLFPSSELVLISVVGPDGNVITSTTPQKSPVNISDRAHFLVHKESDDDRLYISKLLTGRLSGRTVIQFSRKLASEDGGFAGVVVVSVDPTFFVLSFESGTLGSNGVLALVGEDRAVRISRLGDLPARTDRPLLVNVPDFDTLTGGVALNGPHWFSDNKNRFAAWQNLPKYPFIAFAALEEREQLGAYFSHRASAIRTGIAASLFVILLAAVGTMAASRHARTRRHAQTVRRAYRLATEAAADGFYILEAVHDDEHRVIDFEFADCNEPGAELVGDKRERVLGKRVSDFYPDRSFRHVMRMLRKVLERGVYEGEYRVPDSSIIRAQWAHVRLVRSGNSIAITLRDISQAMQHIEELKRQGNQDALTSLYNRHWLHTFLPNLLGAARDRHGTIALLYIDIDGFKAVNDTMGHAAGDELLKLASIRLQSVIRPRDKAVRLGGDEFLIVLEDVRSNDEASHIAGRIVELLSEKFKLKQGVQTVGVSVGISIFPKDGDNAKTLLQNADIAMYSAKQEGKGQYRFFNAAFYERLKARLNFERKLRDAVELDQFVMYYQPRLDIETGRVCSLEALVRWNDPASGVIEPVHFIGVAEQSGLIVNVGKQAIRKVCEQIADWCQDGRKCVPVSINISPKQFNQGGLHEELTSALAQFHIPPHLVELEVTESSMMSDKASISEEMASLQQLGVKLLIDDFGTGYSSLSQLQKMDTEGLKVDRSFTAELGRSEEGEVLFSAIVTMAHALGMRVVAEGVETAEQARIVKRLKCDEMQGYYVSRPVAAEHVPELINMRIELAA